MSGTLTCASPFDLGQFFLLGRKTGVLHLTQGEQRGELHFLQGQIVSAVGPDLKGGQETAMALLKWTEGKFRFVPEPVAASQEIELGTENLMLETARLMDESGEGERQIAASLEAADELSRTFAAITQSAVRTSAGGDESPSRWLFAARGRALLHVPGHPLAGTDETGRMHNLDEERKLDPGRVLGCSVTGPPYEGWLEVENRRVYLSWGAEGYRIVYPHCRPSAEHHLADHQAMGRMLSGATAVGIYGPSGAGKSLLAAILATAQAAEGFRVLYLTGIPSHDLGDGQRLTHVVSAPGGGGSAAQAALERWHPEAVVIDLEPSRDMASFVQNCRRGGLPIVLTLRAPDAEWARESVQFLLRETTGWQFLRPSVAGEGPALEVTQDAA